MHNDQHGDRSADRSGQVPKVYGDRWPCSTTRTGPHSRAIQGPEHARRDVDCKVCHEHRVFYAFVSPDPAGVAQWRVDQMAMDWQHGHPCIATYAHPRKIVRAA